MFAKFVNKYDMVTGRNVKVSKSKGSKKKKEKEVVNPTSAYNGDLITTQMLVSHPLHTLQLGSRKICNAKP